MTAASAYLEVLFLVPATESKGGIGRLALYLGREFAAMPDVRLRVIPTRWTERSPLKHLSTLPALASFAWQCATARPRIVHVNVAPKGSTWRKYLFWSLSRALGARTILHLHGSGYDQFFRTARPAFPRRIRRFFCAADHVVVLGAYWKRFMMEEIGVPEARISVIDNGVPEPPPRRETKASPPLIATMGLVGERKGTDVLIEALASLPPSLEWQAVVGGDGEVDDYRALAEARGLGDRICFLGWIGEQEVDRWLNRASIFVLPSRAENQPVAILEAMARSLPVVATHVGAIPEQVVDGGSGSLVPPGDAEALAAALLDLLQSPDKRATFGEAGRERYAGQFSIRRCAEALRTLYLSLADGRRS
jgi:glycosyltransferase involved in cell wall biosynthesis